MTISYRRPLLNEASRFAAVHLQCWHEAYAGFLPPELVQTFSLAERTEAWGNLLAKPDRFVIGAFSGNLPVGFVTSGASSVKHIEDQDGHLFGLYIVAAHQRLGIGRKLVAAAAKDWLVRGGKTMSVGVLAENRTARAFYESLGAALVQTGTYNWGGFDLQDCLYVWRDLNRL